jgi:hypothetical protein
MDKPHKKLDLWNAAMELAVTIYQVTDSFPREERYSLTDQIRRAVSRSLRKNYCGTVDIQWSARVGQAPSIRFSGLSGLSGSSGSSGLSGWSGSTK